jgi:hypothetical protein
MEYAPAPIDDTLYMLPGQEAWSYVRAVVLPDSSAFLWRIRYVAHLGLHESPRQITRSSFPHMCGNVSREDEDSTASVFNLVWQDFGHLCNLPSMALHGWWLQNRMLPGESGSVYGVADCSVMAFDSTVVGPQRVRGSFVQYIVSYDDVRGNVDGVIDPDSGGFTWADVWLADSLWAYGFPATMSYRRNGPNPARGASYWNTGSPDDVSLMALRLINPNHPYVRDLGYGEYFSQPRNLRTRSVPADTVYDGNELRIFTDATYVRVEVLTNGMSWVKTARVSGGMATISDIPDGTSAENVWVSPIQVDGISEIDPYELPLLPSQLSLGHNYPNPFNPSTTVPLMLTAPARVRVTVYNILGRQVATLADGPLPAGTHLLRFDGSSLPTGVYICYATGGLASATSMLLLVR